MSLPAADLLESSPGRDRRTASRLNWNAKAHCRLRIEGAAEAPILERRDISIGGFGLVLGQAFGAGSILKVDLSNPARGFTCSRQVQVKYAVLGGDGHWLTGFAFLERLEDRELEALS